MLIELNDTSSLMLEVQSLSSQLKSLEIAKNYASALDIINQIQNKIQNFIKENNPSNESKKWLNILSASYANKKIEYNYVTFASAKVTLVKKKMMEKYLGKRRLNTLTHDESMQNQQNNITNISEYEIVQSSSNIIGIIKEILEICKSLIKYYEIQSASVDRTIKNVKQVQSYESFFVYDYQNTTVNISPFTLLIEKYIEEVRKIKKECEVIIESDFTLDLTKVKSLEREVNIIKEEFQKLYPKYHNLKEILEKNNLVKPKAKK